MYAETYRVGWDAYLDKSFEDARDIFLRLFDECQLSESEHNKVCDSALFMCMKLPNAAELIGQLLHENRNFEQRNFSDRAIYEASQALYDGDKELYWSKAEKISPKFDIGRHGPWNRGVQTRVTKKRCQDAGVAAQEFSEALGEKESSEEAVLVFSADSNYFNQFSEISIGSYRDVGGTEPISITIINPDKESFAAAAALKEKYQDIFIDSIEVENISKARMASIRYMVAGNKMRQFDRSALVLDIDLRFQKTLTEYLSSRNYSKEKIGLRISPRLCLPWQKITVNAVYLPNNYVGRAFAEHLRVFLEKSFFDHNNRDIWWVDQNAALSAYLQCGVDMVQNLDVNDFLVLPQLFADRKTTLVAK